MDVETAFVALDRNTAIKEFLVQETRSRWDHKGQRVQGGGDTFQVRTKIEHKTRVCIIPVKGKCIDVEAATTGEAVENALNALNEKPA